MTGMETDGLVTPDAKPDTAAATLNGVIEQRDALVAQLRDSERAQRFGTDAVEQARQALTTVERRRLIGEATEAETRKAEAALEKAKAASREPWGERIEATRMALRDVEREIGTLIGDRLEELLAGVDEEAEAVRERANAALEEVVSAYRAREAIAQRIDSLAATIRRPRYGDIALSKLEPVVREASRVLEGGGEAKPALRSDPRLPRGGSIPAAPESMAPPVRTA
jgi:uncharacterized coiled-coil DUF342 family protein